MTIFDYAPLSFWRKERRRWWLLQKNGLEYMPWENHMRRECQALASVEAEPLPNYRQRLLDALAILLAEDEDALRKFVEWRKKHE